MVHTLRRAWGVLFILVAIGSGTALAQSRSLTPAGDPCDAKAKLSEIITCLYENSSLPTNVTTLDRRGCEFPSTNLTADARAFREMRCLREKGRITETAEKWEPGPRLRQLLPTQLKCREQDPTLFKHCFYRMLTAWDDLQQFPQCWDAGPNRKAVRDCLKKAGSPVENPNSAPAEGEETRQ